MKDLKTLFMSGKEVLPLVEGGKGVSITTGQTAGAWANAGGIGTFSGVNADSYDENGTIIPQIYKGKTREDKHKELVIHSIRGGVEQARIAHEVSNGNGRINMNILWEMGGAEEILHGILSQAKEFIHGITCGAGMPYKLAEIAAEYKKHYYPIISSARAFRALWKRSYHKVSDLLGGVVYEDPWLAGGHNGLSNSEDPNVPENPMPRIVALRQMMKQFGLDHVPIIMAGGVWFLREWSDFLDNEEVGPIAFQYGTRPLLTKESPISDEWKRKLLKLKKGDVYLNRFSPTGFYSSAVENDFLKDLIQRTEQQVDFSNEANEMFPTPYIYNQRGRKIFIRSEDLSKIESWVAKGQTQLIKTPDETAIFVTPEKAQLILKDQQDCMGCLSACKFSNWSQGEDGTTGKKPDPRSFCIQKTLQKISHSSDIDNQLMFAGHNAFKFKADPFYENGFIPTVKQLVERIMTGD